MLRLRGIETDLNQGIHILHDNAHNGYLSISDENDTSEFYIQTADDITKINTYELRLDIHQLQLPILRNSDIIPKILVVDNKGYITAETNYSLLLSGMLFIGCSMYYLGSYFL